MTIKEITGNELDEMYEANTNKMIKKRCDEN